MRLGFPFLLDFGELSRADLAATTLLSQKTSIAASGQTRAQTAQPLQLVVSLSKLSELTASAGK
jgi:hypothetical protein